MRIDIRRAASVATVLGILWAPAGCMLPAEPVGDVARKAGNAAEAVSEPAGLGGRAGSDGESAYLRHRADETRLVGVADDAAITYLEFADAVPPTLVVFDAGGHRLPHVVAGRIAAVAGVHAGLLLRDGDRASFAAPNPRAGAQPRIRPASAEHAQARERLEQGSAMAQAMRRALDATGGPTATSTGGAAPGAVSGAVPSPVTAGHSMTQPRAPGLRSPADLSAPLPSPLAIANAAAVVPDRGLIRVFFATASRAIVAPDDGLAILMREAVRADEIRVVGFTDATGSADTNENLARARADAVVQILIRRGVAPDRIYSGGIASGGYLADNGSDRGRALNRRAEIHLLRGGAPLPLEMPVPGAPFGPPGLRSAALPR